MADGDRNTFVVQELAPVGGAYVGGDPVRFEWDVAHRNMPFRPVNFGAVELRTKKTLYPGTSVPSEQVFGSSYRDLEIKGEWSDKWNYVGYAEETSVAFERLVRRGNRVKLTYRAVELVGLIVDFVPEAHDTHRVAYSFRVSLHEQQDEGAKTVKRTSLPCLDPKALAAAAKAEVEQMAGARDPRVGEASGANAVAPIVLQGSSLHDKAVDLVRAVDRELDALLGSVDSATVDPVADAASALLTIASGFAQVRGRCQQTLDVMDPVRSDQQASMGALDLLNFEDWRLGIIAGALRTMALAYEGERQAVSQAKPDAIRLHEAKSGDTLIGLALRYLGSAGAWTIIADRNGIEDFTLRAGQILVIPGARA